MYGIVDRPLRKPKALRSPIPTYDVKIIAGRRVVIFHDNKSQVASESNNNQNTNTNNTPSLAVPLNGVDQKTNDDKKKVEIIKTIEEVDNNNNEETMLQTKAASVPAKKSSSRQQQKQHQQKVPLHPNYHSQRRLSLGETFTVQTFEEHSKYPILPPLTAKSSDIEIDDDESRNNIDHRVQNIIQNVNQRTLDTMLRDMRKCDRDRDRVLHPIQIENIMDKYKIGMDAEVLPQLQKRFVDKKFNDMTNYEDMVKYFCDIKEKSSKNDNIPDTITPYNQTATTTTNKSFKSRNNDNNKTISKKISQKQTNNPNNANNANTSNVFEDREDAKLILQLESAIGQSPKFDLEKLKSSLESKDMYGNGQVSKQHVIQATSNANLSLPKDILYQWLAASDPIKRGIYNIPTLMAYLERSQVIDRVKSSKLNSVGGSRPISKSSTLNFSNGSIKSLEASWEKLKPLENSFGRLPEIQTETQPHQSVPSPVSSPLPQNLKQYLNHLKQALARSYQELPGYLSEDDVKHVCTSYSAAYQMNISQRRISESLQKAKKMDPSATELINIGLFCRCLDEVLCI